MSVIKLPIVTKVGDDDSVIIVTGDGSNPLFTGSSHESLACGACGEIVGRNVSTRTLYNKFATRSGRLIFKCRCGAFNKANVGRSDEA